MRLFSLTFLAGILLLQQFSFLPAKKWMAILLFASLILFIFVKKLRFIVPFLLGFTWCLFYIHHILQWSLPSPLESKSIVITGHITSIPHTENFRTTFLFSLKKIEYEKKMYPAKGLVRLSWQNTFKPLHVGEVWQFTARLKKIHSTYNPGGFDYEAHALHEGLRANGYIVARGKNKLLHYAPHLTVLNTWREHIKEKIDKHLPQSSTSHWIMALILGERNGIPPEQWEILRNTGTNHLMAIAGLHIGFMSSFAFAIVAFLWRRIPFLVLRLPAQHAGALAALAMGLIYSALAGFSIPTQRACIMLTVFLITVLLRRKNPAWFAWCVALLMVLLINPLSVLTESFWLSFGAVAFIIYGYSARLSPSGWWWKYGRIQWVIAVGLIPFSIWLFQECSIISFIANSIAIPWTGFLIVPLSLLGAFLLMFSDTLGSYFLQLADFLLSGLWWILTWFSQLPWGAWYQIMPNQFVLITATIAMLLFLLPKGFSGRWFSLFWLLPLLFYPVSRPERNEVRFTLLDVGQGLASVVQTKHHLLIFDTGAKLSPSYDMGESVVIPFVRTLGTKKIDMLVVSHGDNDHIGGADAVIKRLNVLKIKTSVPEKFHHPNVDYCQRGEAWEWDGVRFKFLYPSLDNLGLGNDSSCVLRISTGNKHILLTGDIEKYAEEDLVDNVSDELPASILVVPHHGSKTSGLHSFVQTVHPDYILFPIGYLKRSKKLKVASL